MIRSTKTTIKFSNTNKKLLVKQFLNQYKNLITNFVDLTWENDNIKRFIPIELTSQIETNLSARIKQCASKQASGIVRGTKAKQKKRKAMIDKLNKEGKFKKARKLQKIYDKVKVSKPEIKTVEAELDSRFIKIDLNNNTSFDGWVTISSLGNKEKIILPFKKSKHFNKMLKKGKLKTGIRLSENNITFMFEISDKPKKTKGSVLGIDIGKINTLSCSNGFSTKPNKHNHDLTTISDVMSKKKKGSKAFKRCQEHRKNYINWSVNQLNLNKTKRVNLENIKNLRLGKKTNRKMSHWTYTDIFDKIESKCEELGVQVVRVSPTYTSQRCSQCGWTRKSNRKGKLFKCTACGHTQDADLNASVNIALPLFAISKQQRLQRINRKGFYWLVEGQECIVPVVNKT